jgi:hypothetical protein
MMVPQLWQVKVSCPGNSLSDLEACIATLQIGQGLTKIGGEAIGHDGPIY